MGETIVAELSLGERVMKAALGPALLCGWWYFAPDYSRFLSTPLGQLTIGDILGHVAYLFLLAPALYAAINWFYEAWTGRNSVWLWYVD